MIFDNSRYPTRRMRRNRSHPWLRRLVAETDLSVSDLIWPIFIEEGSAISSIKMLPGVMRYGIERLTEVLAPALALGIPAVALFPFIPEAKKTPTCEEAWNPDNLVCRAIRTIKRDFPDVGIICDVALDPYNSYGHDGLVRDNRILNDETLEALCKQAIIQAQARCDILAPSDMMDGRIGWLRRALDDQGFTDTALMSYSAKYASAFYGPFREAVGSATALTFDKKTYQMDSANSDEALREVSLDLDEGADMVIVKPGLLYLDIIRRIKDHFRVPTFAYMVSGEYAMIAHAANAGSIAGEAAMWEAHLSLKRAGADGILTYAAPSIAKSIQKT
ncbi:MAG: porphobilinogen synthase [Alphaproteobacteria bacterium]